MIPCFEIKKKKKEEKKRIFKTKILMKNIKIPKLNDCKMLWKVSVGEGGMDYHVCESQTYSLLYCMGEFYHLHFQPLDAYF